MDEKETVRARRRRTISNPNEPSIMSRTRSATLPMSIMAFRSLAHSMNVSRRVLPEGRRDRGANKMSSGRCATQRVVVVVVVSGVFTREGTSYQRQP